MNEVAALFVAGDSIYKALGADCYDAERNALTYAGNAPVVAHPPCQLWGKMAKINHLRWGGEHNRPGNDGGCFQFALDTVNRCGGVLEHPAESQRSASGKRTRRLQSLRTRCFPWSAWAAGVGSWLGDTRRRQKRNITTELSDYDYAKQRFKQQGR